jgi:hypothetical protein
MILCGFFKCRSAEEKVEDQLSTCEVSFEDGESSRHVKTGQVKLKLQLRSISVASGGPRSRSSHGLGDSESPYENSPNHTRPEIIEICRKMRALAIEVCRNSGGHVRHPHRQSRLIKNGALDFRMDSTDIIRPPPSREMNMSPVLADVISKTKSLDGVVDKVDPVKDKRRRNTVTSVSSMDETRRRAQRRGRPPLR